MAYKHVDVARDRILHRHTLTREKNKNRKPADSRTMFFQLVGIKNATPLGFVVVVIPSWTRDLPRSLLSHLLVHVGRATFFSYTVSSQRHISGGK